MCVLDEVGDVTERAAVSTTREAMEKCFGKLARCRVVLEVGTHSPWVSRLLEKLGHEAVVANAHRASRLLEGDDKTDVLDAESLARWGRLDPSVLKPIRHRGVEAQRDRGMLQSRTALMRARTLLINHVRGVVKAFGGRITICSTESFHRRAPGQLPEELREGLVPVVSEIGRLTALIRGYDRQIEVMATERYPETALMRQVKGVGALTAVGYVLAVDDPHRFRRSRTVGAYFGLRPKKRQSGTRDPELRISKAGDAEMRRLLVQAAHYVLGPFGPDTALKRWGEARGEALATRGKKNAKKRAIVAVARKLAVLLHRLWVTAEVYEPLRGTPCLEAA
jgi:transposase